MKYLIIILFMIYSNTNNSSNNIKNGFYYGHNKGFFPQASVFIHIKDSVAFAEGFYPLKGVLLATFTDTLYYSTEKSIFNNEKSSIFIENNKLYFKREDDLLAFRVEKVKLQDTQSNKSKYNFFKKKSASYFSFWNKK